MARFGKSTDGDVVKILSDKDAGNTKKATKCAMQSLTAYIMESGRDINLNDCNLTVLAGLLASFYMDARKKDSSQYKLSALKAIRFGLSRYFKAELDIDIIKDAEFRKTNEIFQAVSVDLKRKGLGKIDHTQPIDETELKTLYTSMALNPNTPSGLQQKVWFDLMFFLCRRGRENLRGMNKSTFGVGMDSEKREYVFQETDELDKNHRVNDASLSVTEGRMYSNPGHPMCPVMTYKKYLQKLHPDCPDLWQRPKDAFKNDDDVWYCNVPMGKNSLSKMMVNISKQAKLSREYSNHSIRATSITVLDFNKFEARDIMSVSGHKSESSLKSYSNVTSTKRKMEMCKALTNAVVQDVPTQETLSLIKEAECSTDMEELVLSDEQWNSLLNGELVDVSLGNSLTEQSKENKQPEAAKEIKQPGAANVASLPFQGFTPYITGCVVNFNVKVNN